MAVALKLSDELVDLAKPHAAAEHRSVPKQIEYWARLGKAVEDNPELVDIDESYLANNAEQRAKEIALAAIERARRS